MKRFYLIVTLALYLSFPIDAYSFKPLAVTSVVPSAKAINKYEKIELTVGFDADYKNPFDPADVDLSAVFISPSSKEFKVAGFLYSGEITEKEVISPVWKIRFSPNEEGEWRYRIILKKNNNTVDSLENKFVCAPSNKKGFARVSSADPYYFEFSNGEFCFPIGLNVAWLGGDAVYNYEEYYKSISKNGGNWSRLWMCSWGLALEWKKDKFYGGLGRYNLKNAKTIDQVLQLAEKYGIYVQLVINNHGQLSSSTNAEWGANPYNAKNGGPCESPREFFINEEAKKLFKDRVRYIIARWGYSPNIFSWELWNEVDLTDNFDEGGVESWHIEMADFIRKTDPSGHMVTTSFARPFDYGLWRMPCISYTQVHQFSDNLIGEVLYWAKEFRGRYKKPFLIAEAASTAREGTVERKEDPQGIRLHNALWSSVSSSASGTAMYWWWDSYIKPRNLFSHFKPIAAFVSGEDRRNKKFEDLKYEVLSPKDTYNTLSFTPFLDWQPSTASEFVIGNDGRVSSIEKLSRYFQGNTHSDMRITPDFFVDYPQDGNFILNVDMASESGARVAIYVDDQVKLDHFFQPAPVAKHIKESFEINIAKGKHKVRVENSGKDWFRVRNICLTDYSNPLEVIGIQDMTTAYIWLKNREYTVDNYQKGARYVWIEEPGVKISGLKTGDYSIEYFDTVSGESILVQKRTCEDNTLTLAVPTFNTDLACRIKPVPQKF